MTKPLATKIDQKTLLFIILFSIFALIILSFLPFNYVLSANDKNGFLANVSEEDKDFLTNKGYELEDLKLSSSPGYHRVKRKEVGVLSVFLYETLGTKIRDKREEKIYTVSTNDYYFGAQWNIPKIQAGEAWTAGANGSNTVTVAVLDTGLNVGINDAGSSPGSSLIHEEFTGRIWVNSADPIGGGDNNSNGKIDDTYGWDFVSNDYNPAPNDGGSANGNFAHGTLVAGVIGATSGNTFGIAGLDQGAKIMPLRVMNNSGSGSTGVIAQAVQYAKDNGADVINMSLGSPYEDGPDATLENAINEAYAAGVIIVAAAGNDDAGVNYPGASPNVIAVGATDSLDRRVDPSLGYSWGSGFGPELDVMGPGASVPTTTISWVSGAYTTNSYSSASGTSLATPHITGQISLLIAANPALTNAEIMDRAVSSSDKLSEMLGNNHTTVHGFGRMNILKSLSLGSLVNTNGTLVKAPANPNVYYIEGGQKRWIGDSSFFRTRYKWENIFPISEGRLNRFATGSVLHFPNGTLLKGTTPAVYVLDGGQKRWITDPATFNAMGYSWSNIITTSDAEIAYYSSGSNITDASTHPNGTLIKTTDSPNIYILDSGNKRWIGSPSVFNSQFYMNNVAIISSSEMSSYPTGGVLHYPDGTVLRGSGPQTYVLENGQKRWITDPGTFNYLNFEEEDVIVESDAEINYYASGTNL